MKYERSLVPSGSNQQASTGASGSPSSAAGRAWAKVSKGARGYGVTGKGEYGYQKHAEDAKDGSYKKGDFKTGPDGQKLLSGNYGSVSGVGAGWGNRKGDLPQWKDAKDHSKGKQEAANQKVSLSDITGIPEPDLKKIKSVAKHEVKGAYGTYAGYDVKAGSASGSEAGWDVGLNLGKQQSSKLGKYAEGIASDPSKLVKVKGPSGYAQGGARADAYAGIKGKTEGAVGSLEGGAKADAYAYGGASGKYEVNQDGASARGATGVGVGVGVSADVDAKTKGLKVEGVTDPLTMGVGMHGEANAWAKAGVGAGAYLTKKKVGLVGQAGIGAVAEAKADLHGHIGPVAGTYGVGVLAGAGAGLEGGILWEDGKLVIGGRAYAALGYGVSSGGKVVIDLKQSYELGVAVLKKARALGIEGARQAYAAADADHDGKLSLNDAATHGSNAMKTGAEGLAGGIRSGMTALDGDGDGKFNLRKDLGAHLDHAGEAVHQAGQEVYDRGKEAYEGAVTSGKDALRSMHKAADVDGDGVLSLKDAGVAFDEATVRVEKTLASAGRSVSHAVDETTAWGKERLADARAAVQAAHKFADRTGDGKLGVDDVGAAGREVYQAGSKLVGAGVERAEAAYHSGKKAVGAAVDAGIRRAGEAYDSGRKAAHRAGAAAHKALDRDGDGTLGIDDALAGAKQAGETIQETADRAQKTLESGYHSAVKAADHAREAVFDAADVNRDGKVDQADAEAAARKAAAAAERARAQAARWAAAQKRRAAAALAAARDQAAKVAAEAHDAIDRTGDGKLGLDDVALGASEARDAAVRQYNETRKAVVTSATQAYESASRELSRAASTLSSGYSSARATVSGALDEARRFFSSPW